MTQTAITEVLARRPGARPRIAVVLGSGWGGATQHVTGAVRISYAELDGFPHAGVGGHAGELWLGRIGAHEVALMSGRQHAYETGAVDGMKAPLQTLRALGCEVLVQTNAAGSTDATMRPGSLMLVADHLNLPQRSPLVGEGGPERFVSMANAYDDALRAGAMAVARTRGTVLHEGVYAWFLGPQFETPAEIRMAQRLGAHAVGMSTVPETILARHAGLQVLGLSLITNFAAGLSDERLSHGHTLATAQAAAQTAARALQAIVPALAAAWPADAAAAPAPVDPGSPA